MTSYRCTKIIDLYVIHQPDRKAEKWEVTTALKLVRKSVVASADERVLTMVGGMVDGSVWQQVGRMADQKVVGSAAKRVGHWAGHWVC